MSFTVTVAEVVGQPFTSSATTRSLAKKSHVHTHTHAHTQHGDPFEPYFGLFVTKPNRRTWHTLPKARNVIMLLWIWALEGADILAVWPLIFSWWWSWTVRQYIAGLVNDNIFTPHTNNLPRHACWCSDVGCLWFEKLYAIEIITVCWRRGGLFGRSRQMPSTVSCLCELYDCMWYEYPACFKPLI